MSKIKVRIAVAVDPSGNWNCAGWRTETPDDEVMALACDPLETGERRYWVEAELDIPEDVTVTGQPVAG